jgi:hypothetical protein
MKIPSLARPRPLFAEPVQVKKIIHIKILRVCLRPGTVIAHSSRAGRLLACKFRTRVSKGSVKQQSPGSSLKRILHFLIFGSILLSGVAGLMFHVLAGEAHCADVTVAWDPNPEPAVRGYNIYYGTSSGNYTQSIDVGSSTSCVISGLQPGATYYMAVTAYDDSRNESGFSNEIVYATSPESSPASSSGNRCFIATAAFGSPMAPEVALLRAFRDTWLLTNAPGRIFVDFYYRVSPPIADFISRDENRKQITRMALAPLIFCVKNMTAVIALIFLPMILWILRRVDWKPRLIAGFRKMMSGRRV